MRFEETTSLTVCDFRHKTQLLHTGLKKRRKTTIKDNNLRRKEGKQTKRLKDEAVLMCTLLPFPSEYNTSASTSDLTTAAVVRASLPGIFFTGTAKESASPTTNPRAVPTFRHGNNPAGSQV